MKVFKDIHVLYKTILQALWLPYDRLCFSSSGVVNCLTCWGPQYYDCLITEHASSINYDILLTALLVYTVKYLPRWPQFKELLERTDEFIDHQTKYHKKALSLVCLIRTHFKVSIQNGISS